jgi:hypothetical protein
MGGFVRGGLEKRAGSKELAVQIIVQEGGDVRFV